MDRIIVLSKIVLGCAKKLLLKLLGFLLVKVVFD